MPRMTVSISGQVQGVGFRFSTVREASRYEVTGYVKNEPDGTVRVVAEGRRAELEEFFKGLITSSVGGFVRDTDIAWSDETGEFDAFGIKY